MISIVIPNFNSVELLKKNLPKLIGLLEKSKLDFEIIVSDDASTDDSVLEVEKVSLARPRLTRLIILKNSKNTGFAGNVDRGIRSARGEIVFTIKTDALPTSPDYFQLMLNHFDLDRHPGDLPSRHPGSHAEGVADRIYPVFAVSAALETMENGKKEIRGSGEIYFKKGFFLHRRSNVIARNEMTKQSSAWSDGSASAFRKDLYLKLGGFDSLFNPFYWEDVDLGFRAWKAGYQIDFEPKAVLEHSYESGAISRHYSAKQIKLISLRNQFIFVWKNADLKHLLLYFLWEPYHFTVALKNGDWLFFRAYWQAFLKWPDIIKKRISQKTFTKLTDDQVLGVVVGKNCDNL